MKKIILFLLIFSQSSQFSCAQDFLEDLSEEIQIDEIDRQALDENLEAEKKKPLSRSDFTTVDEIEQLFQPKKLLKIRKDTRASSRTHKDPKEARVIKGVLRKGSIIYNFKDNYKAMRTSKDILVDVEARVDKEQMVKLIGKSGEKKYQTKILNINSIQDDIDLPPEKGYFAKTYKEWPPHSRAHTIDYNYTLNVIIKYHKESFRSRYFDQLNGAATKDTITTANRFEFKGFYDSPYSFDFGINSSYQMGNWSNEGSEFNWSAIYVGPSLNWSFVKNEEVVIQTQISYQYALDFSSADSGNNLSFSANVFQIDMEGFFPTSLGKLGGGLTFRSYKLAPDTATIDRPTTKDSFWSIAINVGFALDFTI